MLEALLERNADPDTPDSNGWTPVRWAAWQDHPHILELLVNAGADVDFRDCQGDTNLIWALNKRNPTREPPIKQSVSAFGDPQLHIGDTWNLQTSAAYPNWILPWPPRCSDSIITMLIHYTKNIDAANASGRTPLIQAADNRQFTHIEMLLARGAQVDRHDDHGLNALLYVLQASGERYHLPETTIGGTAVVHIGDHIVIDCADDCADRLSDVESSTPNTLSQLISAQHIEAKDRRGRTALALAAASAQDLLVKELLALGADIDSIDVEGKTPLDWAHCGSITRQLHVGPLTIRDHVHVSLGLIVEVRGGEAALDHLFAPLQGSYDARDCIVDSILRAARTSGRGQTSTNSPWRDPLIHSYGDLDSSGESQTWNFPMEIDADFYLHKSHLFRELMSARLSISKVNVEGQVRLLRGNVLTTDRYPIFSMWKHSKLSGVEIGGRFQIDFGK